MPTRRSALTLPLLAAAAACAGTPPEPPPLPEPGPVGYRHLTPLPLNIALIEVLPPPLPEVAVLAGGTTPLPAEAVQIMAQDRLVAVGTTGRAVFTTTAASLQRNPGRLDCLLACRLEILGGGGERLGFVEAQAQRGVTGAAEAARPWAADALLRRTMDDLNVEFEFQIRRNLRDWLVAAAPADEGGGISAPAPAEVSREELPRN